MGITIAERPPAGIDPASAGHAMLPAVLANALLPDDAEDDTGRLLFETSLDRYRAGTAAQEPVHAGSFTAGTLITTPSGEVPVQLLRLGDAVMTRSALRRTIKWVGRRSYTPAIMAAHPHLRPVRLRAGCLADGTPRRDLLVAPMQALLLDDGRGGSVLVPAAALVNGTTITRDAGASACVAYLHIELNSHDVILAEGAASETYVDCGNRAMFQNAVEFAALYPRNLSPSWSFCAPLLTQGYALEAIRARLAARAGLPATIHAALFAGRGQVQFTLERQVGCLEGWAVDLAVPEVPVELDIRLNGRAAARVPANRYRPDLDHAGLAGGRCGFSFPLPAGTGHIAIRQAG